MDRKTDRDKLQIQGLVYTNFATWLARLFFAASGEPSSERCFTD